MSETETQPGVPIRRITLQQVRLPLGRPYVLSFATLRYFDTLLAHVTLDDGRTATGEVVPLPGYSDETVASVRAAANRLSPQLLGLDQATARRHILQRTTDTPFAGSLLVSALDHFAAESRLNQGLSAPVPLVAAVAAGDLSLEAKIEQALNDGFQTIKVKVGVDFAKDLIAVDRLHAVVPQTTRVRFDANQAYTSDQAARFGDHAVSVLADRLELIEQPLPAGDWDGMARLCRQV